MKKFKLTIELSGFQYDLLENIAAYNRCKPRQYVEHVLSNVLADDETLLNRPSDLEPDKIVKYRNYLKSDTFERMIRQIFSPVFSEIRDWFYEGMNKKTRDVIRDNLARSGFIPRVREGLKLVSIATPMLSIQRQLGHSRFYNYAKTMIDNEFTLDEIKGPRWFGDNQKRYVDVYFDRVREIMEKTVDNESTTE